MNKLSFWKKLSLYFTYRSNLLSNKKNFIEKYNLRIDRVNRIYTVVNIPADAFEEPYNIRTTDINKISEPFIAEYIKQVSITLNTNGLSELFKLYDIQKVDRYSYLIIIGFSLFDTSKMARKIFLRILPSIFVLLLISFLFYKLL